MSRKVHLAGVVLATLASPHDLRSIGDHCGPVEALPEHVAHKGAWCRVVAASSSVDVPKQLPTLGNIHIPKGLRLYSSLSIKEKDLAHLAMRRA